MPNQYSLPPESHPSGSHSSASPPSGSPSSGSSASHPSGSHPSGSPAPNPTGSPLPEPQHKGSELEKEFELERMILFSDAVFAIAITLLVIDIKWPDLPEKLAGVDMFHLFRPTIFGFLAFLLSFFFIGQSWSTHLRLFRLLRTYDQGLIKRNLFFLFFIVIFPFTASGMSGHVREGFLIPLYAYIFNIALVTVTHFLLCRYILYGKTRLAIEGQEEEKKYVYMRSLYAAIATSAMALILIIVTIFFPRNGAVIGGSCALLGFLLNVARRRAKKYKPANTPS